MQKTADEVTVKQVHIKDDFWSEIQNRIINVVIPFQERVLNDEVEGVAKSHAIENFRIAAGIHTGEFLWNGFFRTVMWQSGLKALPTH